MLEKFLEEVDEKIDKMWESSASKAATVTPPASVRGLSAASPGSMPGSTPLSGTTRSTPLRPVRMSPTSASPKKGEGDVPPPMSMEKAVEGYKTLGIYPEIEEWRDCLRQWFSSFLINPLLAKIKTSHVQVTLLWEFFIIRAQFSCLLISIRLCQIMPIASFGLTTVYIAH